MKQNGRASILIIAAMVGVIVVAFVLLFFGGASPGVAASNFMNALARGNVNTLTKLTYLGSDSPAQIRKKWQFALSVSKYYRFTWSVTGETRETSKTASAEITIIRNADHMGSYAEQKELPLVMKDGQWKVDVGSMDYKIFPAIPRPG